MEAEIIQNLQAVSDLLVWACRIVCIAVGVLLFRYVSLRSPL